MADWSHDPTREVTDNLLRLAHCADLVLGLHGPDGTRTSRLSELHDEGFSLQELVNSRIPR